MVIFILMLVDTEFTESENRISLTMVEYIYIYIQSTTVLCDIHVATSIMEKTIEHYTVTPRISGPRLSGSSHIRIRPRGATPSLLPRAHGLRLVSRAIRTCARL